LDRSIGRNLGVFRNAIMSCLKDNRERYLQNIMNFTEVAQALDKLNPIEMLVFKGIVSGDGDIGGRMASSHPDAVPPVSAERKRFLEKLSKALPEAEMSSLLDKLYP
jgi:hypothetical protein